MLGVRFGNGLPTKELKMSGKLPITQVTVSLFDLLEPLEAAERTRAINAAFALLGQPWEIQGSTSNGSTPVSDYREDLGNGASLKPNAERWRKQYQISNAAIENIYHIDGDEVTIISTQVPGSSKRERSANCYLLVGVRNLLASNDANFTDREAVEFCQQVNAHDSANHAANRASLGPRITGTRATGFKLTVPGLRDAAALIKSMTSSLAEV
jgi:hypothetical protein